MIYIRPAVLEDMHWVGTNLREEDQREVTTVHPAAVFPDVVVSSADQSAECYSLFSTSSVMPMGLFGVHPDLQEPGMGIVWFLGTAALLGKGISVVRESVRWLDHMSRHYPRGLHNYADARNDLHLRWCQIAGFTLGASVDVHGYPFIYIHRLPGSTPLV